MKNENDLKGSPSQFLDAYEKNYNSSLHYQSLSGAEKLKLMSQAIDEAKNSNGNVFVHFEQLILERRR